MFAEKAERYRIILCFSWVVPFLVKGVLRMIEAIDLFCGVGGLSYGLARSGIEIKAGVDIDRACAYAYETNLKAKFIRRSVKDITGDEISALYSDDAVKLLAGCAPCQPFSQMAKGRHNENDEKWSLLEEFARLVEEVNPDLVTMENVPGVRHHSPFKKFHDTLERLGYQCDCTVVQCTEIGVPQRRSRFVLVASRLGSVKLEKIERPHMTVRDAIGHLPAVESGHTDANDNMHKARKLSAKNLERIKVSKPGGSWRDWPESLRAPCHQKEKGASFGSVYARMEWDKPSPTITTQCYNFGTGRFGHPTQDRAITLREAALLQSFPENYRFVPPDEEPTFTHVGRLIGNAVPPKLGEYVGEILMNHVRRVEER